MPWFKVDDQLHMHTKWRSVSKGARALWTTAGSWAASQADNGYVPSFMLSALDGKSKEADELVSAGLWKPEVDGWRFHEDEDGALCSFHREDRREPIPEWMRQVVLARDGLRCGLCGGDVDPTDIHLDHIQPVSRGGLNRVRNLQVAHSRCNLRKGNRVE